MKMKNLAVKNLFSVLILTFFTFTTFALRANLQSAQGKWTTIDDKTGKALSVVHIYKNKKTGMLEGKVVTINPILGQKSSDKCKKCKGDRHNKPILGMYIMWNMQPLKKYIWGKGRVLDPKSGHIYRGKMTLVDNGCKLNLRGYIGIPLFGRTETWHRAGVKKCKFSSK